MNGQLMELWGRTLMTAAQGPNQMDMMTGWFQRMFQETARMNSNFFQMWGADAPASAQAQWQYGWEQVLEPFVRIQEMVMQWIGMVPQKEYAAQSETISRLEEKVAEQTRTIEKLQRLLNTSGTGNDELIHQFQGLIDEQSRQFKQLTANVGEFIKAGALKPGTQK